MTTTAKHTPGPWKFYRPSEFPDDFRISTCSFIDTWNHGYIGRLTRSHDPTKSGAGTNHPREEDARLMSAAPDLLAACKRAIKALAANGAPDCEAAKECRAAIAKAEGGAA